MSDDLTTPNADDSELVKKLRSALAETTTSRQTLEQELQTSKRMGAFRDAGIDPNNGVGRLLFQSYDGDPTPDAVKAAAEQYGIDVSAPPANGGQQGQQAAQQEPSTPKDEQRINQSIDDAAGSGTPPGPVDPTDAGLESYSQARQQGASNSDAMAAHFQAKLQHAAEQAAKRR